MLTPEQADIVFQSSPFHEQEQNRSGLFWTVDTPIPNDYGGVQPLLGSRGGESSYFWLRNDEIAAKLKEIGSPRIIEVETPLRDSLNAYDAAKLAVESWARHCGLQVVLEMHDVSISDDLEEAEMLRIHTAGDGVFETVGRTYPRGCINLLKE